jgi:hypothetical protein
MAATVAENSWMTIELAAENRQSGAKITQSSAVMLQPGAFEAVSRRFAYS